MCSAFWEPLQRANQVWDSQDGIPGESDIESSEKNKTTTKTQFCTEEEVWVVQEGGVVDAVAQTWQSMAWDWTRRCL